MRDVVRMWRDPRMVALTVVIAAVYMATLIPSSGLVIIPGFTTIRLGTVLPVVFGLLYGPAAAWGAAIGNLASDVFGGTLTFGSVFGFVGNFLLGFVPYRLWGNLGFLSSDDEPDMRSLDQIPEFLAVALAASAATGAVIGWGTDMLGLLPFSVLATIVTVNDFLVAAVLGPPILYVMYPQMKAANLLYVHLMPPDDLPAVSRSRQRRAAAVLASAALVWAGLGVTVSVWEGIPPGTIPGEAVLVGVGPSGAQAVLGALGFLLVVGAGVASGERLSALVRRDAGVEETRPELGVGDDVTSESRVGRRGDAASDTG